MKKGDITFYRVLIEHRVMNVKAVRQTAAMEMMLGSAELADVMAPNNNLSESVCSATVLICQTCALVKDICIAELYEKGEENNVEER